jgi:NADH-quinone oxidoreductase subunit C
MWDPPTGPPNDVPLRPADARREIAQAIETAQARDRELRAEIAALARRGIEACGAVEDSTAEAAESRALAKRALERAEESARAGQRADAARLTGAARVFALRLRDARARVAGLEAEAPRLAARRQAAESALAANAAMPEQVAVARLASLSARRAARLQAEVHEATAALSEPVEPVVAAAERDARAAREAAAAGGPGAANGDGAPAVGLDDLEDEVDLAAADPLLDELRAELGIGDSPPAPAPPAPRAEAPAGRR